MQTGKLEKKEMPKKKKIIPKGKLREQDIPETEEEQTKGVISRGTAKE